MVIQVAVTEAEFRKAEKVFVEVGERGMHCFPVPAAEESLAIELERHACQFVIVGVIRYTAKLYQSIRTKGVIARFGVGHDGIDKAKATEKGILCTNTPGVLDASVAEHTIGLILALARNIASDAERINAGEWVPRLGAELAGKKLSVIGCGGIGRRVARIASHGLGMKVVGLKRSAVGTRELQDEFGFEKLVQDFDEAVANADFVSLHLPSVPETQHYLNQNRLEKLPSGSYVINTGRGALVDETALFDALANGKLGGAALDVFEREPYQPQSPEKDLRRLPNVVLTPHTGSSTREACDRMAKRALQNIQFALAEKYSELDLLNPDVLRRIV